MDMRMIGIEHFSYLHLGAGLFVWALILLAITLLIKATVGKNNKAVPIKNENKHIDPVKRSQKRGGR